jgi:voltage-gated potassium channel
MVFVRQASAAAVLVWLTLLLQSAGMAALIYWIRALLARGTDRLSIFRSCGLMVRYTSAILGLHLFHILMWAGFYRWNCFPSWEAAFYFSAASYSTVGYGDLVLPRVWRSLGPIESVTGVLMCGLSAALLFAIVLRLVEREAPFSQELARPVAERKPTPAESTRRTGTERRAR